MTKFRPCIDLHAGAVKQIVGSTLVEEEDEECGDDGKHNLVTNFVADRSAAEFAALYRDDGLRGGHVVMLDQKEETVRAALSALHEYEGGLQVGGGVNADNARRYLEAGASHVIVTSFVFREGTLDEDRLSLLENAVGKKNLVLDLSCRSMPGRKGEYFVVTNRWQKFTDMAVSENVLRALGERCDEFLVHGVDVEGMRCGIMEDLVRDLGLWSRVPVTYAGGARDLSDFERVRALGADRVDLTVGSALDIFGGDLPYKTVVEWHNSNNDAQR